MTKQAYSYIIAAAAFASMAFSVYLWFLVDKDQGLFVGIWVPSILIFGAFFRKVFLSTDPWRRAGAVIIACALISFLASVGLWFFVDKTQGLFVGLWVPSILGFGTIIFDLRGEE